MKPRYSNIAIQSGAVGTITMGLYHFFIPYQFGWLSDVKPGAHMVAWALIMVNFCFSFLLVGAGINVWAVRRDTGIQARTILITLLLFWIANLCYQVMIPMPLPPALASLHWVLVLFAFVMSLCLAIGMRGQFANQGPTN